MNVDQAPCPLCGAAPGALSLTQRWEAPPLGTWSLAGAQTKTPAVLYIVLVCAVCGLFQRGHWNDDRHVVFPPTPARWHGPPAPPPG